MKIVIRKEKSSDYKQITNVNDLAFGQNNEGRLIENLRMNSKFIKDLSIVAEYENKIVGHILFLPINIFHGDIIFESLSLAPMAVLPDYQLKGIGSKLIRNGLEKAIEMGFKSVIVLGHKKYYPKFGFKPAINWNIKCPYDVPNEVFMALELMPGSLEKVKGTVEYPIEFDEMA